MDNSPENKEDSAVQVDVDEKWAHLTQEMDGQFVQPMPIEDFLDEFLPVRSKRHMPKLNCKKVPRGLGKDKVMCAPLVSAYGRLS